MGFTFVACLIDKHYNSLIELNVPLSFLSNQGRGGGGGANT